MESRIRYLGIFISISLAKLEIQSFVCRVANTRCPVKEALTAILAVNSSLISEIIITSGSDLRELRKIVGKLRPISSFT